jgi:hypothetical protein
VAAQLAVSQEGFSSVELISYLAGQTTYSVEYKDLKGKVAAYSKYNPGFFWNA